MNIIVVVLLVFLVLGLVGTNPTWGYAHGYGWGPSGAIGLVLVVVLILAFLGRI